ncbi:hypothetical protein PGIGA_G00171910 [Pangasianodon gigas]|uniref:Uncharacterized protein n=1 Tax=Pangasianodon gigas TaxID=30993 RepID=A0ACC5XVD9_PANGG|nr:hypothetical protein [Pangasianodon gigas]
MDVTRDSACRARARYATELVIGRYKRGVSESIHSEMDDFEERQSSSCSCTRTRSANRNPQRIRLVVEEGLNQLPYSECTVITPTGHKYEGVKFEKGNCGVSIMRSGEAMEQGLRDCCRSIRIGKILIQSDEETQKAKVFYAKFPPDISRRKVLLMYPILSTGNTVIEAVRVLKEHGLQAKHILLLSLFSTPHGARSIVKEFPDITILTTEVHAVAPTHFGQRYFGTD